MNPHGDPNLDRQLQEHYRASATQGIPPPLLEEVRAMLSPRNRRRGPWGGPLLAFSGLVAIATVGLGLTLGQRASVPPAGASPTVPAAGAESSASPGSVPWASPTSSPGEAVVAKVDVLRGAAIRAAADAAIDESPFLIGGELAMVYADCFVPQSFPETPLLRPCGDGLVIKGAGSPLGVAPLVVDAEQAGLTSLGGAAVLRVHTHDSRAADCPASYRPACERALVVEQVLWSAPSDGAEPIPTTFSLLPPQLAASECTTLRFEITRCVAIAERARAMVDINWPDVELVNLGRPTDGASLGSVAIASVTIRGRDGTEHLATVSCRTLRGPSAVCGAATVEPATP